MIPLVLRTYFKESGQLCLYQIGSEKLCSTLSFPHVHTVALIRCSRIGVSNLLTPERFPNLKYVHYLSAHPGQVDIYKRFSKKPQWLFPNDHYLFYNCMIEAGMGKVEDRLVSTYVSSVYNTVFHSMYDLQMDLQLPDFGMWTGKDYKPHLLSYLQEPYQPSTVYLEKFMNTEPILIKRSKSPQINYGRQKTEQSFFEVIMNECEKEEKIIGNVSL